MTLTLINIIYMWYCGFHYQKSAVSHTGNPNVTDDSIQVSDILNLTVSFKFINFSFQIFFSFCS
jgi:hypothetical protein